MRDVVERPGRGPGGSDERAGDGADVAAGAASVLWIDPPLAGLAGPGVAVEAFTDPAAPDRARQREAGLWLWTPGGLGGAVLAPLEAQRRATAENAWRKAFADHLAMGGLLVVSAEPDAHRLHTAEALVDSGWPQSLPVTVATVAVQTGGSRWVAGEPFASALAVHAGLFAPMLAMESAPGRVLMRSAEGHALSIYLNDARGRLLILPALDPDRIRADGSLPATLPRALLSLALRLGIPATRAALDPHSGLASLQRELRDALAQRGAIESRIAELGMRLEHLSRAAPLALWGRGEGGASARFDAAYAAMSMLREASVHAATTEDDDGLVLAGHDGRWCALVFVDDASRATALERAARLLQEVSVTGGACLPVRRDADAGEGLGASELARRLSGPGRDVRDWFEAVSR